MKTAGITRDWNISAFLAGSTAFIWYAFGALPLHIAVSVQLGLTAEEIDQFRGDLVKILTFVEQMNTAELGDVIPMAHPSETATPMRSDDVDARVDRDRFQQIAPAVQDGLYLVPKVVE